MAERNEPGRTTYEMRFAGQKLGPRGVASAWANLEPEAQAIWARIEAAATEDLRAAAREAVQAHDARAGAVAAESVDEAIEAEKRLEDAIKRLRALIWNQGERDDA
ncbi:hypothetical protein [Methylobacterium segetis]|uniref:hypothetical protein n=1 Tax=Methylobacterium segetis TaxID=2488750 RepID=UPI001047A4A3|nr:hypothetical protein [Methylobacterium segetis]